MAQGKPSAGEQGAKRPPKTSTRVQGSGRASPVEKEREKQRAPRVPDDEMEGLFVDAAPESKKSSRAADRRRERGQAPPPAAPPDTRTSLPQREQDPSQLSAMSEAGPKAFVRAGLVCTRGPEEGLSLSLIDGSYTIGRARENSFVLKDIAASRRHLRIDVDSRGARVIDLGSGNGTRVNGKRIGEHDLRHGDRIEIGGSVLLYQEKGKAAVPKPDEPVDDAQERVIRAAEKLAAELSGRMRFGDESQAGFEDGHQAKTQAIPKEAKDKLNEEIRKQKEREREKAAAAAPPRIATPPPSGVRSEKLWNETFTNLPLDKVVPADEPLRGPRAAEAALPPQPPIVPAVQSRAPLPRPAPLPLPPPPPDDYEVSQSVSRGGSAFLYLVVTALAVVVIGGIVIGVYALTRNQAEEQVASDVEADFAQAMAKSQEAFKAGDWFRSYEYATAALQLRPGDPMAATYQRDARERIDATRTAPPAVPEPTPSPAPAPAPAPVAPAPVEAAPAVAPAPPAPTPPPAVVAAPPPVEKKAEEPKVVEKPKPAPAPREAAPPPPPKPRPAPTPRRSSKGMSDEAAQAKFEDAVNALRDKDTKKGCRLLEEIADKAPGDSRWKEKAESLFSRRCD